MRALIGAVLIVAASMLVAGGLVAEQLRHNSPASTGGVGGTPGFLLGGLVGLFGIVYLFQGMHDQKAP